ncbi:MAG: efflux RND transporter permease subunit [Nostoc sp.]|uniref:efflux RND transporter periplasmic adaptor subunit n=1 Tax=Nostoc sp. TaxID=1180 RepID=UPI002FF9A198
MLTTLTSGCQKNDPAANAQSPPLLPVKLQQIGTGTIEESSEFVGSLEAQQKVTLQPQIQGRIESILVSSGQRVQQGTPIASLSLDQAQANVTSSIAAASSVQAALGTAQAEQQQAEAQRTKAAANVQLQRTQFNRTQQLVTEGAVARQESDIARNNLQTAIADLQTAEKQVAAARAAVRQAQANIRQAQASTAAARVSLNFKQVVAPITGVVGEFPVKVGDYVNIGQTITTLTQNDSLDLNLSIPSNRLRQLRTNLPVQLIDPTTQQLIGVFTQFTASTPQFQIDFDRTRLEALNIDFQQAVTTLGTAIGSQYVNDFTLGQRSYRVYVQADANYRRSPDDIRRLYVRSANNQMVPLSEVAKITPTTGPSVISHYNGFRAIDLQGREASGYSSGRASLLGFFPS